VSGEIVCSFAALDVLGEALRVNLRRFPFAIPHHGTTREDRIRLVEAVHRDLVGRGLVRDGEFTPELVETLHVFARGHLVIALVGAAGDAQPAALAVTDDRAGVVAEQQDNAIVFRRCQPDAIVPRLMRLLPPMRPGPGVSVTVADTRVTRTSSGPLRPTCWSLTQTRSSATTRSSPLRHSENDFVATQGNTTVDRPK
jgi:hypothetical protein